MDQCGRTSYLLIISAVLWLRLATGKEDIPILQDKEIKAAVGTSVRLSCRFRYVAQVNDPLFGKFYTDSLGKNAGTSGKFSCQTDGRLTSCEMFSIINVTLNLSSVKFICEVTIPRPDELVIRSGHGTTVILYAEPVSLWIQPQDLTEGKEAGLRCDAHGFYPANVTVSWLCGERREPKGSVRNNFTTEADGTSSLHSWYKFTPTAGENDTPCFCKLYHHLWTREREAWVTLNVSYSPRAIQVTSDLGHMTNGTLQLVEGSLLNVTCAASGRPLPEIQWFWENMTRISSGGNLLIATTTEEHEGMYWCVARNQYGQSSASMLLLISPRNSGPIALYILGAVLIVTLLSVILWLTPRCKPQPNRGPAPKSTTDGVATTVQDKDDDGVSEVLYAKLNFAASRHPKAAQGELEVSSAVVYSEVSRRKESHVNTGGQEEALQSTYVLVEWPSRCPSPASALSSRAASPSLVPLRDLPQQPKSLT
ncbi:vascular cell adhesion protein 1-like [Brienomyrus brachyistius]|uniref:vascular cell adhesion protein 1-like n=1 Tax=Brienomyrus brachyistius TaxID=42636 RepID=UPI0020B30FB8|nr:vascular cell adhesion protein 1-like [Brienomyrus brachyistius]